MLDSGNENDRSEIVCDEVSSTNKSEITSEQSVAVQIKGYKIASQEVMDKLFELSQNFELQWNQIKRQVLGLLNTKFQGYDIHDMKRFHRSEYLKRQMSNKKQLAKNLGKRSAVSSLQTEYIHYDKRQKIDIKDETCLSQKSCLQQIDASQQEQLSREIDYMFHNYCDYPNDFKIKVTSTFAQLLKNNSQLLNELLSHKVDAVSKQCANLLEQGKENEYFRKTAGFSTECLILLHLKMALHYQNLDSRAITLRETLLPYLNKCLNYNFIDQSFEWIAQRMFSTIIDSIIEDELQICKGFILFGFHLQEQHLLIQLIKNDNDIKELKDALLIMQFTKAESDIISNHARKFLWPKLIEELLIRGPQQRLQLVNIIKKIDVMNDPGAKVQELCDLSQRSVIIKQLMLKEVINIDIQQLILVLQNLVNANKDTIIRCLSGESSEWHQVSKRLINFSTALDNQASAEQCRSFFNLQIGNEDKCKVYDEVIESSKSLSKKTDLYDHNDYQATLAAIIIAHNPQKCIVTLPPGSGKTWVMGIICNYLITKFNQSIVIITTNRKLQQQLANQLFQIDLLRIKVYTIKDFYQIQIPKTELILCDEFDEVFEKLPYYVHNSQLKGIWDLKISKIWCFSATKSKAIDMLCQELIGKFNTFDFKSEYHFVKNENPLGYVLHSSSNESEALKQLIAQIKHSYLKHPIICFLEETQLDCFKKEARIEKWRFLEGPSQSNLKEIRDWSQGILILQSKHSRGYDTKFASDCQVNVSSFVNSESQLLQMIGRASRTRGISQGNVFISTGESQSQFSTRVRTEDFQKYSSLLEFLTKIAQLAMVRTNKGFKKQLYSALQYNTIEKEQPIMSCAQLKQKNPDFYSKFIQETLAIEKQV